MSKVAIKGNASGTGTFTLEAPNSNVDRTLTLPDEAGTVVTSASADFAVDVTTTANVGAGTASPAAKLDVHNSSFGGSATTLHLSSTNSASEVIPYAGLGYVVDQGSDGIEAGSLSFSTYSSSALTERMRITSGGDILMGSTSASWQDTVGARIFGSIGTGTFTRSSANALLVNRLTNDGALASFLQDGTVEGEIVVSGTTVSYNGGHLARWSRLADDSKDTSIVKGTVMTNLDEMVEWSHDAVEAQDAVYDEDGNVVSEAVEAKEAYTEDNEQLNKMAVSSVEGDPNVAGVFVNWDEDDDDFNDMNVAMTGDMVIRIAQGTTVQRGDLLMSAGDGTAKPQGDDIVRSKTIAKVTSTHVSHTYDDGSYLVPCVLMAC